MKSSIDPNLWGSNAWSFIHYTALAYPDNPTDEDKMNYKSFYYGLQNTLPCLKCSLNYKKNIQELPIDNSLGKKEDLFRWTVNIHNMVNNELGKKNLNYDQALQKYTKNSNYDTKDICIFVAVILLFLLILYLVKK